MAKKASKKASSPKRQAKVSKAKSKAAKVSKKKSAKSKSVRAKRTKTSKSSAKRKSLTVISTGAGAKLAGKVGSAPQAAKVVSAKKSRYKSLPLTPEALDEFRTLLLQRRRELLDSVAQMRSESLEKNRQDAAGNLSKFPTNPADLGSDNYELEFTLSLLEGEQDILNEIDKIPHHPGLP